MIPFPSISPEIFTIQIGGAAFSLRWYALAYLAGLIAGWRIMVALMRRSALWGGSAPTGPERIEDLLTWIIAGVVLGGRLGFVLFYEPAYYLAHPGQILRLWEGGMSFHGGFLGVVIAAWVWAGVHGVPRLRLADALAVATPVGLGLGRVANFINAELWGRPTSLPWGVIFPGEAAQDCPGIAGPCARHPSQLYEAGREGVLLALALLWLVRAGGLRRPGLALGVFLAGYGAARFVVEFFRQADAQFITPDNPLGHVIGGPVWGVSMGQALSLPMIAAGGGVRPLRVHAPARAADSPRMTALAGIIAGRIALSGPMRLDEYMALCLMHPDHGYYATRDPFGAAGDFTTAPEISQMFGELAGLALAQAWLDQGRPAPFTLAELGPGRGTLMADALRATARVPGWAAAHRLHLVETSPHLRQVQRARLGAPAHLDGADDLPEAPLFLIANEFFDALPIRQFERTAEGWCERMVTDRGERLGFALSPPLPLDRPGQRGDVFEFCPAAPPIVAAIAGRIARHGGCAIIVDYGTWDGQGDSFQALRRHRFDDPFAAPGAADLTAHVDFAALAGAAIAAGAAVSAPVPQGEWLGALGIAARAERLAAAGDTGAGAALERLTGAGQMGQLFKALAIWPGKAPPPPGFRPLESCR